ncbi:MAG: restriction endonuclease subunit S, partial [Streptococcaceae bacterium]|nr:restriction endonuclease subunit S [Streptococcaceae bacterium]
MTPEQLKASILQRAMEGKLVSQDPNDEPASELLKRIKAEKEKLIKAGKIKRDKNETEIFRAADGLHYEKFADGTVKEIEVPFEIPESWDWVRLSNLVNVVSARRVHKSDWQTKGIPFYRAREIARLAEYGNVDNDLYITEKLYEQYSKSGVPKQNDLMVTAVGTLGKTYVVKSEDKFYYKDASVLCFENFSRSKPEFIQRLMESPFMKKQIMDQAMGTTVATLTISRANQYFIPLPPINEQDRIVKRLEFALSLISEYDENYSKLEKLDKTFPDKLRKSILQHAMQGKLVPQDPNDEPVEVLLEKIRAEKLKLYEAGKLKKKDLQETVIYKAEDNSYYWNKEKIDFDTPIPTSWKLIYFKDILKLVS